MRHGVNCSIWNPDLVQKLAARNDIGEKTYSYMDLFSNGTQLRFVSLNVIFNFTVNVLTYYGLTFNAAALPGDIFVNNGIQGIIDFVACILVD